MIAGNSVPRVSSPGTEVSITTPPGYRQSEIGLLPDDWEIATLGALGRPLSGGTPRTSEPRYWNGDIPWISSKDMKVSRLHDSTDHVTPLALGNGTRLVQPGTILMVVRGMSLAHSFPVAIVEKPVAFNQDLKAFVANAGVDSEFVLRWLEYNQSTLLLLATEATHGTKRIPTPDLLASHVPLPHPAEQREIGEALSDVDGLLGTLEALIAKKRAIKQATMQQLLTGRMRLPGFLDEWETKSFDEVLKRVNCDPYQIQTSEYETSGLCPVVDQGHAAIVAFSDRTDKLFECPAGGVIVFGDHTRIVKFVNMNFIIGADGTQVLEARGNAVTKFLFYQFLTKSIPNTGYNRHYKFLLELTFNMPTPLEQGDIVGILSDMDSEIEALERRRDKMRAVKQGMMEQLLTGRVRLV